MAQLRDANGAGWCVLVKLTDSDNQDQTHQIPRSRLVSDQSTRVVEELAELYCPLPRIARPISCFTCKPAPMLGRARKIERTGWHESAFVLPDEVIGPTPETLIYQGAGKPPIATAGTLEGWRWRGHVCAG